MPRKNHSAKPPKPTGYAGPIVGCTAKRAFRSRHDAVTAAEQGMADTMTLELDVYQCDMCAKWHLTSKIS